MALSQQVLGAVLAEIAAVGQDATQAQIQAAYLATKMTSAKTVLGQAIAFSVSDWTKIDAFVAAGISPTSLYKLRDSIDAKIAAHDATDLGVLLIAFFAAAKAHLGQPAA